LECVHLVPIPFRLPRSYPALLDVLVAERGSRGVIVKDRALRSSRSWCTVIRPALVDR